MANTPLNVPSRPNRSTWLSSFLLLATNRSPPGPPTTPRAPSSPPVPAATSVPTRPSADSVSTSLPEWVVSSHPPAGGVAGWVVAASVERTADSVQQTAIEGRVHGT